MIVLAPRSPKAQSHFATPLGERALESTKGSGYKVVLVLTALVIMGRFLSQFIIKSNSLRSLNVCWLIVLMTVGPPKAHAVENGFLMPDQFLTLAAKRQMIGEYPDGKQWREKYIGVDMTLYSEGAKNVAGSVFGKGRFVCFSYVADTESTGGCFEVWRRGANCFDFYGTGTGIGEAHVRTVASNREKLLGLAWSARGWMAETKSTCVNDQIS